jgi:hypothetical protein
MIPPPPTEFWSIERANAERAVALARFGFTDRQARFLVQVLLHSGVFVERQFCQFAGIAHGQKSADFLTKLVSRRYATPITTGALHRGRLFHLHYKPLWAAIGEPDSRFRKPAPLGRLIERVMLLDAVLADRDLVWLGPSTDKLRFFASECNEAGRLRQDEYPHICFGEGPAKVARYFPDKLPIGAKPYGSPHVFLYLVTKPSPADFRAFLIRHTTLLGAVHEWTVRLLFPRHLTKAIPAYRDAARDHLAIAVAPSSVEELRWLFHERRRLAQTPSASPDRRYMDAVKAFCGPRYSALYRAWLAGGEAALLQAESTILPDAVDRERGRLDCVVLSRQYLHLSSLVGVA